MFQYFYLWLLILHFHTFQFPARGKSFQEAQANLNQAAAGLNQSANELVQASRGTTQDLAKASGKFGQDFSHFLEAGVDMAGQSQVDGQKNLLNFFHDITFDPYADYKYKHIVHKLFWFWKGNIFLYDFIGFRFVQSKEDQTQVVTNLKTISMSSSKLLLAAKALSTDPNSPNLKNQLAAAARLEPRFISAYLISLQSSV